MSTKSVLILGGSGFVGSHLAAKLSQKYKVFATYFNHHYKLPGVTYLPLSIDNKLWIKRVLYISQPDTIVYLIGKNSLIWADQKTRLAEHLHSAGPGYFVNPSEAVQPKFIYVSNPYVFDGAKGNYKENDIFMPSTMMGRVKIEGENSVKSKFLNFVIIRSSPLIGRGNGIHLNWFDRMRMNLSLGRPFAANSQEIHSFGTVQGLAEMIDRVIDLGVRNKVLNFGGITKLTEFEFARRFAHQFKYNPALVVMKKRDEMGGLGKNPSFDFSLNSSAAVELLKIKPLLLEESLDLINQNLVTPL